MPSEKNRIVLYVSDSVNEHIKNIAKALTALDGIERSRQDAITYLIVNNSRKATK